MNKFGIIYFILAFVVFLSGVSDAVPIGLCLILLGNLEFLEARLAKRLDKLAERRDSE